MAINLFENQCEKNLSKYSSSNPRGLVKNLSIDTEGSITSSDSKNIKTKKKRTSKSPYLTGDNVQLLSRVTEKKLYSQHKKSSDIASSSFSLAANIYKANSDEFKAQKKGIKKVKKSVLTLPTAPTAIPQTCTVSDMNESEYNNESDDHRKQKARKRFVTKNKKSRVRNKNYEFYDRDARYCSQMNINLDCSSTDLIKHFTGDGKRVSGKFRAAETPQDDQEFNAHDVWAVLRNINRFQFRPSPPVSEDLIPSPKKKKIRNRKRNNRQDTHVIETHRTEEFAYISSFEVGSPSFTQSSSCDRITVIDKQDEFSELSEEFEKRVIKTKNAEIKNLNPNMNKNPSIKNAKKNLKAIEQKVKYEGEGLKSTILNDYKKTQDYDSLSESLSAVDPPKQCADELGNVKVVANRANEFNNSYSGSSKVGITATKIDMNNKLPNISFNECRQQVNGISKVMLSKGQCLWQSENYEIPKRKPRLATTMPNPAIIPKLTQTEIKRRLANLRFPIVVLGREELTSAPIQLMNNEPPHLGGLQQSVWPFMQAWYEQNNHNIEQKFHVDETFEECVSQRKYQAIESKNNLRKINELSTNKQSPIKDKNCLIKECTPNKKICPKRPLPLNEITKMKPQQSKNPKPIHQLKNKMLKLLYKNSSARDIDVECMTHGQGDRNDDVVHTVEAKVSDVSKKAVDVGTETCVKYESTNNGLSRNLSVSPRPEVKKMPATRQPWAKAKWASDFIETVIHKIRNGIYFNQESKQKAPKAGKPILILSSKRDTTYPDRYSDISMSSKPFSADLKEASIQTVWSGINFNLKEHLIEEDISDKAKSNEVASCGANKYLEVLPGFDDKLPALEIKTMNVKEVAVKYCTTNVVLQFDVTVPLDSEIFYPVHNSSSFVPLAITESHTKIFKCKTTIVNAMLPAEICSLVPKIIRSIIDSNKTPPLPQTKFQSESLLYTISELSRSESPNIFKSLPPPLPTNISPTLLKLFDGIFCNKGSCKMSKCETTKVCYNNAIQISKNLLIDVSVRRLFTININPISCGMLKGDTKHTLSKKYCGIGVSNTNTCTTMDLYRKRNPVINTILSHGNSVLEKLMKSNINIRLKISAFPISLSVHLDHNKVTATLNINTNVDEEVTLKSTVIGGIKIDSLYDSFMKQKNNSIQNKAIEFKNDIGNGASIIMREKQKQNLGSSKTRKNRFVKLYKKCKSTSNISGERCSTSLSKINNLDDFFQALGSGKLLSSVFDGLSGKKILSSMIEMKNWITDINQRQAMLVLLLSNKKDTPNLVRFRPILLQGIAVNRITRSSELDMEIEVIEREHFNTFSQYEGIPCIKESIENRDNLMEELYWIAKTTASDYQRPFNEASEKLLKSLLEKRKKLNPSYLRVMARYVGLGLLKSPKN